MNRNRRNRDPHRAGLDTPLASKPKWYQRYQPNPESFGVMTESFARWMGTPQFLVWMTVFVTIWLLWNTLMPESMQFDPKTLNFTLLTLMLSLQASYAAPLLLLAQNRQDDRDRVVAEEDRQRTQQNLADTEYLTREIAALRIALREVATRDFMRSEIRDLVEETVGKGNDDPDESDDRSDAPKRKKKDQHRGSADSDTKTSILDLENSGLVEADRVPRPHGSRASAEDKNE
ncbi:DUF1003 domain-containing protein [Kocuria massiliensis]|uniref:DUF1003 domain-containing protein n=1 Tax=Kocuria massiliensis TaxID=1926282 RepID=UPI0022B9C1BF|nr:DUF1003 domain-containing protein [Kocuria massiliensis]